MGLSAEGQAIEVRHGRQRLRIEPWGPDSARVRAGLDRLLTDLPGALLPDPPPAPSTVEVSERVGLLRNGNLMVRVELVDGEAETEAEITFLRTEDGRELLAEQRAHFWWPGPRLFLSEGNGYRRIEQRFRGYDGERFYGLGQHTHGRFDQKGLVVDLMQRNSEVSIPFLLSNRGYGLLWNNPAVGRVELSADGTRWVADSARQIDYWLTASVTPAAILARYNDVTGHPPVLPDWAIGFWQSKLRYRTQDELLSVAREYVARGLPLSVIVVDFFHWTHLGDWRFDERDWPDPAAMVKELDALGIKLMVSIWPTVSPLSDNYQRMAAEGMLVGTEQGVALHAPWRDKGFEVENPVAFYDATDPVARDFVWNEIRRNYYDLGVRAWWLDACEPEVRPAHPANLAFHAGPGAEVFNMYPAEHARAFHEGMLAAGEPEAVLLCRSAWAGSQRYGTVLWTGDTPATFESLRASVRAGLNTALSGIPWWTTDIGGFHGGDPDDPAYRELLVRWFQYGVFCPVFRLHGNRDPRTPLGEDMTGGPNEIWSFGTEAYEILRGLLELRERLRPYLRGQFEAAHRNGIPPMRPLFLGHPDDPAAWDVEDEFLLGPDLLVAPVLHAGARSRTVYLPAGTDWVDPRTGATHAGGTTIEAAAPLDTVPVFVRAGADVPLLG
jgi:alpha-D-xyloside xylohydrolase